LRRRRRGPIIEYYGRLAGSEPWTATSSPTWAPSSRDDDVFPSDEQTRAFLELQGRRNDWEECADAGCAYDHHDEIDLSALEPADREALEPGQRRQGQRSRGLPVYQSYIGSWQPGLSRFRHRGLMVRDRK